LKTLLYNSKSETSDSIARLFGVIVSELPGDEVNALLKEFSANIRETAANPTKIKPESFVYGSIAAIGFVIGRYFQLSRSTDALSSSTPLLTTIDKVSFEPGLCYIICLP